MNVYIAKHNGWWKAWKVQDGKRVYVMFAKSYHKAEALTRVMGVKSVVLWRTK